MHRILFLCNVIHHVEWSGILFYTVEGSIKDPKNMLITIKDILPMDKGTSVFTEYEFDERFVDYIMEDEERTTYKVGHVHSHHNMAVYFSGTDTQELLDNAGAHNFYLSLIVNNKNEMVAKVAFEGVAESSQEVPMYALDEDGQRYQIGNRTVTKKETTVYAYDCNITQEGTSDEISIPIGFMRKVTALEDKSRRTFTPSTPGHTGFQRPQQNYGSYNPQRSFQQPNNSKRYPGSAANDYGAAFADFYTEPVSTVDDEEDFDQGELLGTMAILGAFDLENEKLKDIEQALDRINEMKMQPQDIAKKVVNIFPKLHAHQHPTAKPIDFDEHVHMTIDFLQQYETGWPWLEQVNDALDAMRKFELERVK